MHLSDSAFCIEIMKTAFQTKLMFVHKLQRKSECRDSMIHLQPRHMRTPANLMQASQTLSAPNAHMPHSTHSHVFTLEIMLLEARAAVSHCRANVSFVFAENNV